MTQRNGGLRASRPVSALISAALLLLTVVAGIGGVGGFAALGPSASVPVTTVATASTTSIPVAGDRRSAPVMGVPGSQKHTSGWAPLHPEAADVPAADWQPPAGLAALAVEAGPAVIALTIQVSHRGRAPPAGSLLS